MRQRLIFNWFILSFFLVFDACGKQQRTVEKSSEELCSDAFQSLLTGTYELKSVMTVSGETGYAVKAYDPKNELLLDLYQAEKLNGAYAFSVDEPLALLAVLRFSTKRVKKIISLNRSGRDDSEYRRSEGAEIIFVHNFKEDKNSSYFRR